MGCFGVMFTVAVVRELASKQDKGTKEQKTAVFMSKFFMVVKNGIFKILCSHHSTP